MSPPAFIAPEHPAISETHDAPTRGRNLRPDRALGEAVQGEGQRARFLRLGHLVDAQGADAEPVHRYGTRPPTWYSGMDSAHTMRLFAGP